MNGKGHGQLRRSQVITTFGPGALIDLPNDSAIVGGLDTWGSETRLEPIDEPRLAAKLMSMTGVPNPRLYAPPPEPESWQERQRGIGAWRFPEWFVVQESGTGPGAGTRSSTRSRRMVPRTALANGRYDKKPVVATRFVRACSKGHVDDIDWYQFVHGPDDPCRRRLWLDERGTSGDLVEQIVRCECGRSRRMHEAVDFASFPLGVCRGARPWLGRHANEECREPSRLLIRTASNAWFPQVVSVLSLPDRGSEVDQVVEVLWDRLQIVKDANALAVMKNFPDVANSLAPFSDQEVLDAIAARSSGGAAGDRPIKHAELDALLAVPEGYGDDAPIDPDFHARRLPESVWRHSARLDSIEAIFQVHRLREVLALAGFTRLEPVMPNVDGEYDGEVERASIALEPAWFPAVENRGEGILVQLRADAVMAWLGREPVKQRLNELIAGHNAWAGQRKSERPFPGGPYVLLHTLAHLLLQSLSMRCGYPAASIRERIFVDQASSRSRRRLRGTDPGGAPGVGTPRHLSCSRGGMVAESTARSVPHLGAGFRLDRPGGCRLAREGHAQGVRGTAGHRGAFYLGQHLRILRWSAGIQDTGESYGRGPSARSHAVAQHRTSARRHHGRRYARTPIRRFADEFWGREWPGLARPTVYYDPRSVEKGGPAGVLHAKAVVADEESVFVTSANLTAAAWDRNIELGLLVRDRALATTTVIHFRTLIEKDLLRRLPGT